MAYQAYVSSTPGAGPSASYPTGDGTLQVITLGPPNPPPPPPIPQKNNKTYPHRDITGNPLFSYHRGKPVASTKNAIPVVPGFGRQKSKIGIQTAVPMPPPITRIIVPGGSGTPT